MTERERFEQLKERMKNNSAMPSAFLDMIWKLQLAELPNDYEKNQWYELEGKYFATGEYQTESAVYEIPDDILQKYPAPKDGDGNSIAWGRCKVWYPVELKNAAKTYPIVVYSNGSNCTFDTAPTPEMLNHFASWGIIAVGHDQHSDGTGEATVACIDYFLRLNEDENSIFYGKIDVDSIGVLGASQGGAGALNAAVSFEGISEKVASVCTMSCPAYGICAAFGWLPVDGMEGENAETVINTFFEKIKAPYFMMAGTGDIDSTTIIPLENMKQHYDACSNSSCVVTSRIDYSDHESKPGFGYTTAWFLYTLTGDMEAAKVFIGDDAEILSNNRWVDTQIKENQ